MVGGVYEFPFFAHGASFDLLEFSPDMLYLARQIMTQKFAP
jgi:hypothetical protein